MTQENFWNLKKNYPALIQFSEEMKENIEETEMRLLQCLWTLEDALVCIRRDILDLQISVNNLNEKNDSIEEKRNLDQTIKD